jgi:hypothetical protein
VYQQTHITSGATPKRDADGRFLSGDGYHGVLDAVADVVRFACGDNEPEVIGRRRYNAAQAAIGSPAPSAQGLVKRFGMPLSRVIDMALEPAETRMVRIAGDGSQLVATDLPTDLMLKAVRAAQLQLGTTLGAFEYDNWVERHIATRRRRDPGGDRAGQAQSRQALGNKGRSELGIGRQSSGE